MAGVKSGVMKLITFLGQAILVTLPLAGAGVFVAYFARDINETASSVLAVATFLSVASLVVIGMLLRDIRRFGERQDHTRAQALALAGCMKALNHRMSELEAAERLTAPMPGLAAPGEPGWKQATPVFAAAPVFGEAHAVFQSPAVLQPREVLQPHQVLQPREHVPIITLPQRKLWGLEILDSRSAAPPKLQMFGLPSEDDRLIERIHIAAGVIADPQFEGVALAVANTRLAEMPRAMAQLSELAVGQGSFRDRFLLGVPQRSIRLGGAPEAQTLARLARQGLRFALVDITDFRIDPEALAACSISHVRIDGRRLIEAANDPLTAGATDASQLARLLKAGGITLMCGGIDDEHLTRDLVELGVELAVGPGLQPLQRQSPVVVPWRAAPSERQKLPVNHRGPAGLLRAAG